jgi:hypothetical protein
MRVALLGPAADGLASSLAGRGVAARHLAAEVGPLLRPVEARLRRRRYEDGLTGLPGLELALRRSPPDLVHAFDPASALAAARWRRRTGGPAVFTLPTVPDFGWIRARRRRRELLLGALEGCSVVLAPSLAAAEALGWWLGVEARVVPEAPIDTYADQLAVAYAELTG